MMLTWREVERVFQAQGMVSVQAECSIDEALILIGERALVQHRDVIEIADAVLEHLIRFGP